MFSITTILLIVVFHEEASLLIILGASLHLPGKFSGGPFPPPPLFLPFSFSFSFRNVKKLCLVSRKNGRKNKHISWLMTSLVHSHCFFLCLCNWDHFPNKSIFSPKMVQSIFGLMLATTKIKIIYKFKLNYEYRGSY